MSKKIYDLTQEYQDAINQVTILPSGCAEESWEDYIDFKQLRSEYNLVRIGSKLFKIHKWGLDEEVSDE